MNVVGLEEQLLADRIRISIDKAYMILSRMFDVAQSLTIDDYDDPNEIMRENDRDFNDVLDDLYRDVQILAARLSLDDISRQIGLTAKKTKKNWGNMGPDEDGADTMRSVHFDYVRRMFASLDTMVGGASISTQAVLENILRNTRRILVDAGITIPKSEAEIYKAVGRVIDYAFNDLIKNFSMPRPLKSYKPEFAIRSTRALIEYKFARNEDAVKRCIDELYIDTRGYKNIMGYTTFYAVVYCLDQYVSIEKIEKEFRDSAVESDWRLILVHGGGS